MGKVYDRIDDRLRSFIEQQVIFLSCGSTAAASPYFAMTLAGPN